MSIGIQVWPLSNKNQILTGLPDVQFKEYACSFWHAPQRTLSFLCMYFSVILPNFHIFLLKTMSMKNEESKRSSISSPSCDISLLFQDLSLPVSKLQLETVVTSVRYIEQNEIHKIHLKSPSLGPTNDSYNSKV